MLAKLKSTLKSKVLTSNDVRIVIIVITLAMFILGAGAPSDAGGLGGY
mgnify:CR=1 FL=1